MYRNQAPMNMKQTNYKKKKTIKNLNVSLNYTISKLINL